MNTARHAGSTFALAAALWLSLCAASHARPLYETKSYEGLQAAVAAIGRASATLSVTGSHDISENLEVPGNIRLQFQPGAVLLVKNGRTVTIHAPIQAPRGRIFDGDGRVVLKRSKAYPQWWGARADGSHDDGHAIQSALDSIHAGGGGTVWLPRGTYLLNHVSGPYYALKARDGVSVIGEGPDSVMMVGAGLRRPDRGVAVLYNHEEPVTNCRYSHFTVDYNGENNPRLASWGPNARVSNVSRMGAEFASEVTIEEVHFRNVSGAHCVWFGNHPGNRRNTVRNCRITDVGGSIPGNGLADHSSIYMGGREGLVSGNVFRNRTPCNISTAIEIHSSGTTVSNNDVRNYATAVNLAGEANDCVNVSVTKNTFRNNRNGIVIWHYAPYTMKNIAISENVVSVREADAGPYPPSMGVIYGGGYVTSEKNLSGLVISGNTFFQEAATLPNRKPNTAIHVESTDGVRIVGNRIYDFNGEAVYLQSRSGKQGMTGVTVSGNSIRNVGITSTPSRKRAIVLNAHATTDGSITDVLIRDNEIEAGGISPMLHGIAFNEGAFSRVEISGNSIRNAAQAEIANSETRLSGEFHIDHRGRGPPVNRLRASPGSRWVDLTSGLTYAIQPDAVSASANWVAVQ